MLISQKKKFIFIHIYKNAGTSISTALKPFVASKWQRGMLQVMRRFNLLPQYPGHIKASELIDQMGREAFESYFSFAIVRNPWDWQVSLYNYALKRTSHHQHEFTKGLHDFNEYIRWRVSEEIRFQKDWVCSEDGELLVDFIGRFERIESDFQTICSRIGVSASLPKLNVSNVKPYRKYYDEETRELVRQAFDPDISLFGYDF